MSDEDKLNPPPVDPVNMTTAPGWVGGFEESNAAFAYPTCDLSSIEIMGNLENIDHLDRQAKAIWPEFSWQTVPGDENTRCFQRFAHDISRLGYTKEGRIFAVICPQQGAYLEGVGTFNLEVTVTGCRGWLNEDTKSLAGDLGVEACVWFGPVKDENHMLKDLIAFMKRKAPHYNFPLTKAHGIKIKTNQPGNPKESMFPGRIGMSEAFNAPEFTQHWKDGAWAVANINVEIGEVVKTGEKLLDDCNQLVVDLLNAAKFNALKKGNVLCWNVWLEHPSLVDREEWRAHAEKWRLSIDVDHGSPDGNESAIFKGDGTVLTPNEFFKQQAEHELRKLRNFVVEGGCCNVV